MQYSLPIKPSPNLPNDKSINLYLACAFEGTNVSVGRGTEKQFQIYGSPYLPSNFSLFQNPIWETQNQRTMEPVLEKIYQNEHRLRQLE
jgi:hypothetical protein